MKTYKEYINEGIRDKMTPKPKETVRKALYGYFKKNVVKNKAELIAKGLFDKDSLKGKRIYVIFDYEDHYEMAKEYFSSLTNGQDSFTIGEHEYTCYPNLNVVEYFDFTLSGWYFDSDNLGGLIEYMLGCELNEGVRDMMTSTPFDDIMNRISHMKNHELYGLMWDTALYEDEDTLKLYIDNGVDINIKNNQGETLLIDYTKTNYNSVIKMLLGLGADPNIGNDNGYTPLVYASLNDNSIITEYLLSCDRLNPMKHDQLNVALKLSRDRHKKVEQQLLSYKENINESLRDKMTPKSKEEIANGLKDKSPQQIFQIGVNINDSEIVEYAFEKTKETHTNIAVLYPEQLSIITTDKFSVLKVILKHQPNFIYSIVKTALSDGFTSEIRKFIELVDPPRQEVLNNLLIYCCNFNLSNAVKILVELGADIHVNKEEPLMNAVFAGNMSVVKELLKYGADPAVDDNRPIEEAKRRRYYDIASVLKAHLRKRPLKKRLSKYLPFLKESLRDKMTPKNMDDVRQTFIERGHSFRHELVLATFINDVDGVEPILDLMYNMYKTTDSEEIKETIADDYLDGLDTASKDGGYEMMELYLSYDIPGLGMSHLRTVMDHSYAGTAELVYDRLKDGMSDEERKEVEAEIENMMMNESVRDKMTPKSVGEIVKNLPSDMGEIYKKSKEQGWKIEINGHGINTYLILNFKYIRITIMKHAGELFANINVSINPMATSYFIPDLSGNINNFEDLKSKVDRLLNIPVIKESLRDKMTPKPKELLDDMLRGKSYKQSLNIIRKSEDSDWARSVMLTDFKTSRQMDDLDMIFNKIIRNNYCKAEYRPTVMIYNTVTYGGTIKVTKPGKVSELAIGITKLTESQINKNKLDKDGNPNNRQVFWFYVQYKIYVESNIYIDQYDTQWECRFFEDSVKMTNFIKKLGFTV